MWGPQSCVVGRHEAAPSRRRGRGSVAVCVERRCCLANRLAHARGHVKAAPPPRVDRVAPRAVVRRRGRHTMAGRSVQADGDSRPWRPRASGRRSASAPTPMGRVRRGRVAGAPPPARCVPPAAALPDDPGRQRTARLPNWGCPPDAHPHRHRRGTLCVGAVVACRHDPRRQWGRRG